MKLQKLLGGMVLAASAMFGGTASAADILCQDPLNNHMLVDDAYVSACIDAGLGNIGQGNQAQDDFLNQLAPGHGYTTIGSTSDTPPLAGTSFTQTGLEGTFTIDGSLWDDFDELFIGFKFGTGGDPDEWFVYQLVQDVVTGAWEFVHGPDFNTGGGLSHITLYGMGDGGGDDEGGDDDEVPEPASLALVGLALLAAGAARRRRKA